MSCVSAGAPALVRRPAQPVQLEIPSVLHTLANELQISHSAFHGPACTKFVFTGCKLLPRNRSTGRRSAHAVVAASWAPKLPAGHRTPPRPAATMASDGIWVPDPDAEDKYPPPKKGMNRMTLKLIRKRAEHNEGIISTLEELTLHQEELVAIEPCLGTTCRKLKILYLQNNIISKIQHLHHLKDLEYLNMALNNVSKIEGLDKCEFLNKLDLTVNFVDVDELEASMDHLSEREHLKDLYMMGNPCEANWPGFKNYVIARLPQLQFLDGEAITRCGSRRPVAYAIDATRLHLTMTRVVLLPILSAYHTQVDADHREAAAAEARRRVEESGPGEARREGRQRVCRLSRYKYRREGAVHAGGTVYGVLLRVAATASGGLPSTQRRRAVESRRPPVAATPSTRGTHRCA